ncbi:DUF262 domain-containing protein [Corynebacterium aurimucosum]|uniref:DUF262 domain-containing protein n=1 Tax=Corynebacterium guaraldiae TaxID=3051103 RepID=A0ABY3CSZ1_9CORY|nr:MULTISPECIES: DUF262 domain-containing protein [Corynebacterium]MBE7365296.1 DUF262 domain-containing protein [Corynebacterium aurimucosum]MTE10644.1 DUF262 domain-containing protein [Corynebacterium guaraldiae]OFQ94549.1 hypothetical protein HMPREF2912_10385 [Corynebacterium sp. HMSC056E09]TRX48435.1 DUF262 domain-containing protein [Corynebacterium guaraldiae]
MGFNTNMHQLSALMRNTENGEIQLPDFQRKYKWEDERVRQLLITIFRGHPLGIIMLLETGNSSVRFKPRPIESTEATATSEPKFLLLDGQQRLTSLTQALKGDGVVHTKDSRGKRLDRRYFINIQKSIEDPFELDEAVISVPADGVIRTNFNRDIVLDLSSMEKQHEAGYIPVSLLLDQMGLFEWFGKLGDTELMTAFSDGIIRQVNEYKIPAIELDKQTDKAAVATVFEKVNVGGLPLNVFELLTAVFAGDAEYYDRYQHDFRLNDDWVETKELWKEHDVLHKVENTDFLQAITMLTTLERSKHSSGGRKVGLSAKREDVLRLELNDYLTWRDALRQGFIWVAGFLADLHIYRFRDVPYPKQLVPLAAIAVVLGKEADKHHVKEKITQWFWSGVLGELYGSAIETRFVRDLEGVPAWAMGEETTAPRTVQDATFAESRLHSLRTRNAAAYKGIAALIMAQGSTDWVEGKQFGAFQYRDMAVDIHHIFPKDWCKKNGIDDERRESIVNKTTLSARTNRVIGGVAPSAYLTKVESESGFDANGVDDVLRGHLISPEALRSDNFDAFFERRRESLCALIEGALKKTVQRDVSEGNAVEDSSFFEEEALEEPVQTGVDPLSEA